MRDRRIKLGFWSSPSHPDDPWARLLFMAMWNFADDYGVGSCQTRELLGFAFPHDRKICEDDVGRHLADIAKSYGVVFYMVGGRSYYYIPSWTSHQAVPRPAKSNNPMPDKADEWLYQQEHELACNLHATCMLKACGTHAKCETETCNLHVNGMPERESENDIATCNLHSDGMQVVVAEPVQPSPSREKKQNLLHVTLSDGRGAEVCDEMRRLVHDSVGVSVLRPRVTRDNLMGHVQLLFDDGASVDELRATLTEWCKRTDVSPGHLPHVYSDLARRANGAMSAGSAKPDKLRVIAEMAAEEREKETNARKAVER